MDKKDHTKIKSTAKSKAAEVFSQEDAAKQQHKLQELLEANELDLMNLAEANKKVLDDNTELVDQVENLKRDKETLEADKADVEKKAGELETELQKATEKIAELEKVLNDMKAEATLKTRISELEEAGLVSSGKTAEKQMARIKSMTDEEFADYKEELSDLIAGFKKEVEKKEEKKEAPKSESASEDTEKKKEEKKETSEESAEDDESGATQASMRETIEGLRRQVASVAGSTGSGADYEKKVADYEAIWSATDEKSE